MPDAYNSSYTGQQIDEGIAKANNALPKSGGTMTGGLFLSGEPTEDTQAATKKYVDDKASAADASVDEKLEGYVPVSDKGVANGVAELDENGELKAAQKPSYTPAEVGADPAGTASSEVSTHDQDEDAHAELFAAKQDNITGTKGQLVGFDDDGNPIAQAAPDVGVTTFNGRKGAVTPQEGDYTADMVGARPDNWMPSADDVGAIPATQKGANSGVATLDANGKLSPAQKPDYTADEVGARPNTWTPNADDVGAIPVIQKGAAGGVVPLNENQQIDSQYLPSYVDDVVECYVVGSTPLAGDWLSKTNGGAPLTPEGDKIYMVVSEDEYQNRTYRWGGSVYAEISASLVLGETSETAYRGDRGAAAYAHSQLTSGNPHSVSAADVGLGNVNNTSDADKPVSTVQQAALNQKQDKITGTQGQLVGFNQDGNPVAQAAPDIGVATFNGRKGAVSPASGDYTAAMVGARPDNWIPTAAETGAIPTAGGTASGKVTFNGGLSAGSKVINNVATPSAGTDAANKDYVDNADYGTWGD